MSPFRQSLGLILFVLLCFGVAGIGSSYTVSSIPDWYAGLKKPGWTPPGWLFGPVWTVLYLAMAVAVWLVWRRAGFSQAAVPLIVFGVQLALNCLWSIAFFGWHNIGLAVWVIAFLWLAIVATILTFRQASVPAAWLLAPYLLWVTFAAALNVSIWTMNR